MFRQQLDEISLFAHFSKKLDELHSEKINDTANSLPLLSKKIINNATSLIIKKNNYFLIEENILIDEEIKFNDQGKKSLKEDVVKKTIVAKVPEKKKKSKEKQKKERKEGN